MTDVVDFANTEAAYAVARILQRFPSITIPPDQVVEKTGKEIHTIIMVLSIKDGCLVQSKQAGGSLAGQIKDILFIDTRTRSILQNGYVE